MVAPASCINLEARLHRGDEAALLIGEIGAARDGQLDHHVLPVLCHSYDDVLFALGGGGAGFVIVSRIVSAATATRTAWPVSTPDGRQKRCDGSTMSTPGFPAAAMVSTMPKHRPCMNSSTRLPSIIDCRQPRIVVFA